MDSFGLDEDRVNELNAWLHHWGGDEVDDSMLLGMLIVLLATDCD